MCISLGITKMICICLAELRELFQQISKLDFETLAEGDLKRQLDICCQAAWVLKPSNQDLYKQLLDQASKFRRKAHQLQGTQEKHLQRQSFKANITKCRRRSPRLNFFL